MNKWVFLAAAAACLIVCTASPIKRSSEKEEAVKASRQDAGELPVAVEAAVAAPAAPAAPVVAAPAEEDDDDDDDYDVGVGDDDDDDDDEEDDEEDDDDDEDYFERFFEDILGDDDEDDEPVGAGSTIQAVQGPLIGTAGGSGNVAPPAPVPAPAPANNDNVVTTLEASVIPPESDAPIYDDEEDEVTSSGAEETDASVEEDDGRQPEVAAVSGGATEGAAAPIVAAPVPAAAGSDDEDEDDDDDDDDLGVGDLADDDDDDEDEDEEDEDEEDDDEEGGDDEGDEDDDDYDTDVASRARSLDLNGTGKVPASLYVAKYNRYVDTIIDRIKKVLRKSYDPVNVRLHSTTKVKNGGKNKNKTGPKRPKHASHALERQLQEESLLKAQQQPEMAEKGRRPITGEERRRGGSGGGRPSGHGSRPSGNGSRPSGQSGNNYQKPKNKNKGKGRPRARATLIGLSSIRRDGDVSINLMSSHTSVRSNFLLGPLVLKVEKEFGRGETKELRSASAVTEEMAGVISLRISPEGTASLHNIRVLQPKQVRVESTDDHDRTREFVWRRSSHIARLVSRKLTAAARSLLGNQKIDQKSTEESKGFPETQAASAPLRPDLEWR